MASEFDLIHRYFQRPAASAVLGVGDDCALLPQRPGMLLAVSTDMLVEGRHFLRGADAEKPPEEVAEKPPESGEFSNLVDLMKKWLPEVADVRLSTRLVDSACCLVTPAGGMSAHLERMLERMGQNDAPRGKRILEINGSHQAVQALRGLAEKSPEDPRLALYSQLLLDEAFLADGTPLPEPGAHARRINDLIARDAAR